jgi:hypothetical protein
MLLPCCINPHNTRSHGLGWRSKFPPPDQGCRFSLRNTPVLSSRVELAFSRERNRGISAKRFLFFAHFQKHRFALIPPRVRFGLRLTHLVGMTKSTTAGKSTASDHGGSLLVLHDDRGLRLARSSRFRCIDNQSGNPHLTSPWSGGGIAAPQPDSANANCHVEFGN